MKHIETKVDTGLVRAFAAIDTAMSKVGGKWASVARYAIQKKLNREIILESLKSMGKKNETAQVLTSRILDLMKPQNEWKLNKLEAGELSVKDARSTTIRLLNGVIIRAPIVKRPTSVRMADSLETAANLAVTYNINLEDFLSKSKTAYVSAVKSNKKSLIQGNLATTK